MVKENLCKGSWSTLLGEERLCPGIFSAIFLNFTDLFFSSPLNYCRFVCLICNCCKSVKVFFKGLEVATLMTESKTLGLDHFPIVSDFSVPWTYWSVDVISMYVKQTNPNNMCVHRRGLGGSPNCWAVIPDEESGNGLRVGGGWRESFICYFIYFSKVWNFSRMYSWVTSEIQKLFL